jgi:hypothetical protein
VSIITLDTNTTLPLPTEDQWRAATAADSDLAKILRVVMKDTTVPKAQLVEKAYLAPMQQRQFTAEHSILFYFEHSKATGVGQLQLRVVPPRL